jgi:hypothetical protein
MELLYSIRTRFLECPQDVQQNRACSPSDVTRAALPQYGHFTQIPSLPAAAVVYTLKRICIHLLLLIQNILSSRSQLFKRTGSELHNLCWQILPCRSRHKEWKEA